MESGPNSDTNFWKSAFHLFHHKKVLKVYSAIGNCAVICQRQSIWGCRDYCAVLNIFKKFSNSMSMSMSVYCQFPFPCPFLYPCQFTYGAMDIYDRHGNYTVDFQGPYEVAQKPEGPLP